MSRKNFSFSSILQRSLFIPILGLTEIWSHDKLSVKGGKAL